MKINSKIIKEVKEKAKAFFVGASGCHDWDHVERVYNLSLKIAEKEGADVNIVKLAAYLHDIGRKEEMDSNGKICHAEKGVILAESILMPYNLDKEIVENIKHCILTHRHTNNHNPKTIEAKVLFDADKLDSIGAVGVARDFLFAGYLGATHLYTGNEKKLAKKAKDYQYTEEDTALLEYYYKLKKVKSKILTKTGKEIAEERDKYMADFFKRFYLEVKGLL
ncbi:MAG: HD domain-containing protein [Minisyncoccales bacterium]